MRRTAEERGCGESSDETVRWTAVVKIGCGESSDEEMRRRKEKMRPSPPNKDWLSR